MLAADGVRAAVVSAPCFEAFAEQTLAYREAVLGDAPRVGVEAAIRQGWDALIGSHGAFVGMTGFGASAPAPKLYEHFGITPDAVVAAAKSLI
jgi:transketolase